MKKEQFRPDFILIPKILIDCKDINWTDRAVYGAVYLFSSLSDRKCFASNNAIAKIVNTTPKTVSNGLTKLEKYGFIKRTFSKDSDREAVIPLISYGGGTPISGQPLHSGVDTPPPISEHINNIYKEYNINILPVEGKSPVDRVFEFYSTVFKHHYGFKPQITYQREARGIKSLLRAFSELQVGMLILLHFDWRGASGTDEFTYKRLSDACFPISWIGSNTNAYVAYFKNSLEIEFDNEDVIKKILEDKVKDFK